MNERIEELAGQAFQYAADNADETGKGHLGVFAEKFAELIVKECASEAFNFWVDQIDCNEESAQMHIKKHFGVEE